MNASLSLPGLPPAISSIAPSWVLATVALASAATGARAVEEQSLASPDGRIRVTVELPAPGSSERPVWSAAFRGKVILSGCRLGLRTAGDGEWLAGARLVEAQARSVDERVQMLFGKADHARDRFQETRLRLETPARRRLDVVLRCYDDAVAFRYELLSGGQGDTVTIIEETTSFQAQGGPIAYAQYLESFHTSHEHQVTPSAYVEILSGVLIDLPLAFSWADGTYAAITEAALLRYAGMSLVRPLEAAPRDDLVCQLTPRPDGSRVVGPLPLKTPWRVVLVGERPGVLLESRTIYCLNDPPRIADTSWIKPGKITFSWWNGDVFDGKPGPPILSLEMARKYIDFCAESGIPTHALTSTEGISYPWYRQSRPGVAPGPDTDVTRPRDGFDLDAIRRHAEAKQVRLWTWVHHAALRGRVEEAFSAFEKLGWSGMMVDFIDHDDQESVEFVESVLESAARHRILIHLHGIWKPTGLERTYPNLVNHEGALNLEYLKWSDRCTPEHTLLLVFTRLIAGPMDYHLGGFRSVTRADFKPLKVAPNVLGTRCHNLAMYVCFDNPNPMVADYPTAYEGQPGFDFVQLVPTWWDETRVLAGQVGELLVTARRKDRTWYLGGLSAKRPRELELPLSFLGTGRFAVSLWKDAPDADAEPNHLQSVSLEVSSSDQLRLRIALDGGFVARISPAGE